MTMELLADRAATGRHQGKLAKLLGKATLPLVFLKDVLVTLAAVGFLTSAGAAKASAARFDVTSLVVVETDRQAYQRGEEVTVTVTNNLDRSVTTFDQQAFCGFLTLERRGTDDWKQVTNCVSGAPRRSVTLGPNSKTTVSLPSPSPGLFRVSLKFSPGEVFHVGRSQVSYSPQFTVR